MKLYELINPSDPYTFYAPSVEVAGVAAVMLSHTFGAVSVEDETERSPVLFGWDDWMEQKGIDDAWLEEHRLQIADALDSFLIGGEADRADVESMLAMLPEDKKQEWRDQRQDRHRSSMNQIGEAAYQMAEEMRVKFKDSQKWEAGE